MADRIAIQFCSPVAGDLYRVQSEDGELHVYDWTFLAAGYDGRAYVHNTHVVGGTVIGPEGYPVANYRARTEAEMFAQHVNDCGSIDPALWSEVIIRPYNLAGTLAGQDP